MRGRGVVLGTSVGMLKSPAALFVVLLAALSAGGCQVLGARSSFDPRTCITARLDQVADVDALFADPDRGCVIVAWDTDMPGAGLQPDGGLGTPPALDAAARNRGFAAPCETTINPEQGSVARGWFATRFGRLSPAAHDWGVTLFIREPLPDGTHPGCTMVTPPG